MADFTNDATLSKSFMRGFNTINNMKRAIVLAKVSEEALNGLSKDSNAYKETAKMLEENLLRVSSAMLSIELEFRNIHHAYKKGGGTDV